MRVSIVAGELRRPELFGRDGSGRLDTSCGRTARPQHQPLIAGVGHARPRSIAITARRYVYDRRPANTRTTPADEAKMRHASWGKGHRVCQRGYPSRKPWRSKATAANAVRTTRICTSRRFRHGGTGTASPAMGADCWRAADGQEDVEERLKGPVARHRCWPAENLWANERGTLYSQPNPTSANRRGTRSARFVSQPAICGGDFLARTRQGAARQEMLDGFASRSAG